MMEAGNKAWATPPGDTVAAGTQQAIEREKQLAAEAAAEAVTSGMVVGLGSGSTVAYLLPALAARRLELTCVATSPATADAGSRLGLTIVPFTGPGAPDRLDVAIDGADQVDPAGWLVKGGGGAHTREKTVAAAADRFIVIVSSNKLVERIAAPIPLELSQFGLAATLRRLDPVRVRHVPPSPDRGVIADYMGPVPDTESLAERLSAAAGVIEHGLFPPAMVSQVVVGRGEDVERLTPPPNPHATEGTAMPDSTPAVATSADHVVTKLSSRSVADTVARLEALVAEKGLKLFAEVDHSGEAKAVGLELRDTKVVIFGSPQAGTPVMQAVPLAALDLPLKVLVWADGDQTKVSYTAPAALAARYGLSDELSARLAAIDALTDALVAG
jgi:ribose 5-phosphate isomerase A